MREASLGLVPLSAEARADAGPFGLADRLGAIYRYDDLFAIKDALAPRWEPRHLVYEGDSDLPRVAVAVVDVHTTLHERSPIPRLIAAAARCAGVPRGSGLSEGPGFLAGFARWIDALPAGVVFALALGTTAVIGIADELTGADLDLTVAYLLPIWFAAWFLGTAGGLAIATACAISSHAAALATRVYAAPHPAVQVLNGVSRIVLFAALAVLLAAVRKGGWRASDLARTDALTGLLNRRGFLEVARRESRAAHAPAVPSPSPSSTSTGSRRSTTSAARTPAITCWAGWGGPCARPCARWTPPPAWAGTSSRSSCPRRTSRRSRPCSIALRLVLMQAAAENGAPVTVSLGAATFQRPPSSLDEMLRAAGRMLHDAKASGRSAVRHDRVGPPETARSSPEDTDDRRADPLLAAAAGRGRAARPFVFTTIAPAEERGSDRALRRGLLRAGGRGGRGERFRAAHRRAGTAGTLG